MGIMPLMGSVIAKLHMDYVLMFVYLHRVSQGDGNSQRQPLGHSHHQHGHTDDEEFDKILDVDRGALG